jgi:hypothetical protein
MLSNILLSRLSPYINEIIGDHQCGFRRNTSATNQIFCIRQLLENKREYNESTSAIHRVQESLLFSEEKSIVKYFYRVLGTHELRLIKMRLNETYSNVMSV